jgi:hypothetical protein
LLILRVGGGSSLACALLEREKNQGRGGAYSLPPYFFLLS